MEPPSSGFATFGDSFWWALVTFTTVGYGDLVPKTTPGRTAAGLLMVGGVALIGVLAGSMSELFSGTPDDGDDGDGAGADGRAPTGSTGTPDPGEAAGLRDEVAALRADIAQLRAELRAGRADEVGAAADAGPDPDRPAPPG